ncbi:MAG: SPOCS domain-containing protein [Bacillota bacterium]
MNLDTCEVKKEELRLEEVVGEGTSQLVISHTVTIPEEKPPARAIIDFVARPRINKVTVLPGKVVVDGIIDFTIIYEATEVTQTVHVFHAEVPFSQFVEIPGAEPGMTANVNVVVEHAVFSLTADGRDVTIRAVAALKVKLTQSIVIEVVTDVTGVAGLQVTREVIKAETVLGEGETQIVLRENLTIPDAKPDASRVIDHVSTVDVTQTTVLPNKIIVNGVINLRIIYEANVPEQSVHVAHFTIPFESFVEIPGAQPGMSVVADAEVEFVSIDVSADGRTLSVRIILKVHVKVIAVRTISVITNVAGVAGIHVEKALVRVQEVLGEDKSQEIVRELVDIPDEKPLAAMVINCSSTPEVRRTIVAPGKVIVDGVIAQRIIYEPLADPTQTVHTLHFTVPFSGFVILPEAKPGMTARVSVRVEHANCEVPPAGEPVMVTKVLEITARVFRTRQIHVVTKVKCAVSPGICTGTVTANLVNVRQGPGMTYAVIAQVNSGTTVQVLQLQAGWVKVRLANNREGWISSQFVRHDCLPLG